MLTSDETTFVCIAINVFPAPLWAALISIVSTLKIMPPCMTVKYSTAGVCVSAADPQRRMIGSASATERTLIKAHTRTDSTSAVTRTRLAPLESS